MSLIKDALAAYRNGLRATRVAFGNDTQMLLAARKMMRNGMKTPPKPEQKQEDQIQHLNDVALFLRRNLVQGTRKEDADVYKLNIHKDIELGDNATIKKHKIAGTAKKS